MSHKRPWGDKYVCVGLSERKFMIVLAPASAEYSQSEGFKERLMTVPGCVIGYGVGYEGQIVHCGVGTVSRAPT